MSQDTTKSEGNTGATSDGNKKRRRCKKRKEKGDLEKGEKRKQKINNRNSFLRKGRNLRGGKEKQHFQG